MHREFFRCHHDLSWSNIGLLFGPDGLPSQFKLIDFGNSKAYTKSDYESYLDCTANVLHNPFFKETYNLAVLVMTLSLTRYDTTNTVKAFIRSDGLQGTALRELLITLSLRVYRVTLVDAVQDMSM